MAYLHFYVLPVPFEAYYPSVPAFLPSLLVPLSSGPCEAASSLQAVASDLQPHIQHDQRWQDDGSPSMSRGFCLRRYVWSLKWKEYDHGLYHGLNLDSRHALYHDHDHGLGIDHLKV
jgi:CubicO group peptidase (beta-lactamase class C family)